MRCNCDIDIPEVFWVFRHKTDKTYTDHKRLFELKNFIPKFHYLIEVIKYEF